MITSLAEHDIWDGVDLSDPRALLTVLRQLRQEVQRDGLATFSRWQPAIDKRGFIQSGLNLAYYLALRKWDLRPLQAALTPLGLSSLGRIEGRVMHNLDAVIATLGAICHEDPESLPKHPPFEAFFYGDDLLNHHADTLFGKMGSRRAGRRIRIMVTLPTEAATDYDLVRNLLQNGMDCIRINCAYDGPDAWAAMIANLRRAEAEVGVSARVLMDLAGPKPRTGRVITPGDEHRLMPGDTLLLVRGEPAPDEAYPFQANCTIVEVMDQLKVGEEVWIDDGKIGLRIESEEPRGFVLRVHQTGPRGGKLRPGKGMNFPDSDLSISPLTDKDLRDLDFVAANTQIIGYSFVREPADIELLQRELQKRIGKRWRDLAIIAKIETKRAVRNLPDLIVQAAGKQPFGVMIARGDLAVEIGYQRLAEMQEEIMWLCEAAHVPVIWATQVLENLVRKGIPTRAEITDAAMSERAECVMLNKGSYLTQAVGILVDVLTRMREHQVKKTPQLRALQTWKPRKVSEVLSE